MIQTSEERLSRRRRGDEYDGWGAGQEFDVTYQPKQCGIYNIYLFGIIEDTRQFTGALEVLARASEDDLVCIHLSTPGGNLDATDTFIQGMRECEARVVVKATGGVHSAGTVILLNADEFMLSENFNCLVHNGSVGAGGKFSDFIAHAAANVEYMNRVMRRTYEGFLTPEEIEALVKGQDFWFNAEQFVKRWEARNAIMKAKQANDQSEALEAAEGMMMDIIEEAMEKKTARKPAPRRKKKIVSEG